MNPGTWVEQSSAQANLLAGKTGSTLLYDPAKEGVKITGIAEPYLSGRIEVGSPEIEQIRIGYHIEAGDSEIRVVFDYPVVGPRVIEVENRAARGRDRANR